MRQVIEIKNEPAFKEGVVSYVIGINLSRGMIEIAPHLDRAVDFTRASPSDRMLALQSVKEIHKGAEVNLVVI